MVSAAGFWNKITGKAQQQPQDIAINVVGINPVVIEYIEVITPQSPTENSITTVVFEVRITDPDGVNDIDDSSVFAEFSRSGDTTKKNNCLWLSDIDSDTAGYSCSIDMQYYNGAGTWNIKINATDFGSKILVEDTSRTFIYQELKAMTLSPATLTWPNVIPGSVNQMSDNDPSVVTNTGNHEGPIVIQAKNLYGETRITEFIPADSFTAGTSTGKKDPECDPATSSFLQDSADIIIINSMLNKGVAAQEEIFYCIPQVPLISSQTYSTQQAGSWTITVLIATIIIKKKKKKLEKKQKSDKIEKDNLVISLILLSKEIKQEYSKEKQEIINLLTKEIKKKYKLNNKEIIQLTETKKETTIPISVFKSKIGALEALCKYMKENLNIKYRKIAELLQRNERTIWTAYNKAKQKQPEPIKIEGEKILLPISILNKKLTVLESVIIYLKQQNLRYVEISKLLNRNQRNIWAIYSRAVKKAIE